MTSFDVQTVPKKSMIFSFMTFQSFRPLRPGAWRTDGTGQGDLKPLIKWDQHLYQLHSCKTNMAIENPTF